MVMIRAHLMEAAPPIPPDAPGNQTIRAHLKVMIRAPHKGAHHTLSRAHLKEAAPPIPPDAPGNQTTPMSQRVQISPQLIHQMIQVVPPRGVDVMENQILAHHTLIRAHLKDAPGNQTSPIHVLHRVAHHTLLHVLHRVAHHTLLRVLQKDAPGNQIMHTGGTSTKIRELTYTRASSLFPRRERQF
jgi:hypothetical protein